MIRTLKSFLKIGLIGFGGGSALIPVVELEVVERQGYLSREQYAEHTILSNITPGALPVKLGMLAGREMGGIAGMLVGAFSVALPGALITILLLSLLSMLGPGVVRQIEFASLGISAFIICLLADYINRVIKNADKSDFMLPAIGLMMFSVLATCGGELRTLLTLLFGEHALWSGGPLLDLSTIDLLLLSFFVIFFTGGRLKSLRMLIAGGISILYVLLFGKSQLLGIGGNGFVQAGLLALGVAMAVRDGYGKSTTVQKPDVGRLMKQMLAFAAIIAICAVPAFAFAGDVSGYLRDGMVSTITSFGGGEAYLTVADSMFVASGQVEPSMLYGRILPIANALPGPILVKILSGIGYAIGFAEGSLIGGCLMALLGLAIGVGGSCIMCIFVGGIYQAFSEHAVFRVLRLWILPIICGLLLSTILAMLVELVHISAGANVPAGGAMLLTSVLFAAGLLLAKKVKLNDILIIALLGLAAMAALNLW